MDANKRRKMIEELEARERASDPKRLALAKQEEDHYREVMREQIAAVIREKKAKVPENAENETYTYTSVEHGSPTVEEHERKEQEVLEKLLAREARDKREKQILRKLKKKGYDLQ